MSAPAEAAPLRVPPLPREDWTEAARAVFAFWGEPDAYEQGSGSNMVMALATHPPLAMAYYTFGRHVMMASTLSARTRELIVLRVAWTARCAYEWHYHVGYALNIGLDLAEIAAIGEGWRAAIWDARDAATLRAVEELQATSRLSAGAREMLAPHCDAPQILDLVFAIGNYVMLSYAIAVADMRLEDGIDPIGFDLKTAAGLT
ncbi:MAG: carboxymuconolactone decarboxylase family protein, partial [Sphingomonas sp.]